MTRTPLPKAALPLPYCHQNGLNDLWSARHGPEGILAICVTGAASCSPIDAAPPHVSAAASPLQHKGLLSVRSVAAALILCNGQAAFQRLSDRGDAPMLPEMFRLSSIRRPRLEHVS